MIALIPADQLRAGDVIILFIEKDNAIKTYGFITSVIPRNLIVENETYQYYQFIQVTCQLHGIENSVASSPTDIYYIYRKDQ